MYCPNCGTKVSDGAKFCPNCGNQISAAKPTDSTASKNQIPISAKNAGKSKNTGKYLIPIAVFVVLLFAVLFMNSSKPRGTYYCSKRFGADSSITINGDKCTFVNFEDSGTTENGRIVEVDETEKKYDLVEYTVEFEDGRWERFYYRISEDMIENGHDNYFKVK